VRLGRQHIRQGWFRIPVQKNKSRMPLTVELSVLIALQDAVSGPFARSAECLGWAMSGHSHQ
jgi:hypothetical protein